MRILICEPGKRPEIADIPHSLSAMQEIVGGSIQAIYPWDDPVASVCDDEALFKETPWNRYICEGVAIEGTFFVCGLSEDDFDDLPEDMVEKHERLFYKPQLLIPTKRGRCSFC